jgi:predicted RND superfamily exporter protein
MNLFNRIVTILLFVVLMIVVPFAMIFSQPVMASTQQFLEAASSSLNTFQRIILILLGIIVFIICGLVLYLEFRRPPRKRVKVETAAGEEVELAVESIAQRLAYRVDQLPDVVKVTPEIKPRRKSIDVELNLETTPEIDVPAKIDEVSQVARAEVEENMGLKLRKIRVSIKHSPYPGNR